MPIGTQSVDRRSNTFFGSTSRVYPDIVSHLHDQTPTESRAGNTKEDMVVKVVSENPRDRLLLRPGINWAFGLQEAFAYWRGLNPGHVQRYNPKIAEFMYKNEDDLKPKLHGSAYGRYFRHIPHDQISRVKNQLRDNPETRQALINVHQADVEDYKYGNDDSDVACTIYLQFLQREGKLHLIANLRSQDMLWGYPYDVHAFQWLQEVLAGQLDYELGTYTHIMNSCHYYLEREQDVRRSGAEAHSIPLPDMRLSQDVFKSVEFYMSDALKILRDGGMPWGKIADIEERSQPYADWIRTMAIYEAIHNYDTTVVADLRDDITTPAFGRWLDEYVL